MHLLHPNANPVHSQAQRTPVEFVPRSAVFFETPYSEGGELTRRIGQRNMQPGTRPSSGPVTRFLEDDHRRLEELLNAAMVSGERIEQGHYDEFRAGLLRHIGMEEKILLPAAQRLNGGAPLSMAATLRLDHGAIAALLMPTPTLELIAMLRSILNKHNQIEEGLDGLYATCDKLVGAETEDLMEKLRAAPAVAVLPHSDTPAVLGAVRRALERAKYEYLSDSMPSS